jgi:nucleotide-binding universal stress UspA family protein
MRLPEAVDVGLVPVVASSFSRRDLFDGSTLAERLGAGIERGLLESQAAAIVRHSAAPVLVVPITVGT